jgi:hypothetical protein
MLILVNMSEERRLTKKDIPEEMRPSKWGVRIGFLLMLFYVFS